MSPIPVTRRRLLGTVVAVGLAGCSGAPGGGSTGADDDGSTDVDAPTRTSGATGDTGGGDGTATATTTAPDTATETVGTETDALTTPGQTVTGTADGELDLREANVVGVEFDDSSRFDVTLYHDDDGEDGYANWWQVESLDGTRLGRRELLHAHGTRPFTRSASISIPDGTTYVVVRGHDQTHGYGGQAMVVDLDTGATEAVRQGPEPRDVSGYEPGD